MLRFLRGPRTADVFFPWLKPGERTGWRGRLHALLTRLGPTWRSAPIRRLAQAACLALFLYAFFYVCWPYSDRFSTTTLREKERFPPEVFLLADPLSAVSTAIAGRTLHWPTLGWTAGIVLVCVLVPRAFCGYACPLGTLVDLFDWLVGRRFRRFHLARHGPAGSAKWWVHARYYVLGAVLGAALGGTLLAGFVAAIPVLTRGLLLTAGRWQLSLMKGASHLTPFDWTFYVSIALFLGVFLASLLGTRFWCRYLCPTGALFSALHVVRVGQRRVAGRCTGCGKCAEICPFDAVAEDFSTRTSDCAFCQSCGGVCPAHAVHFGARWNRDSREPSGAAPARPRRLSRRGFVAASVLGAAAAMACRGGSRQPGGPGPRPIRPPGSVGEEEFLGLCIRCGECFKVCPGPVLQPAGMEHGFESLWTPVARLEHAGCHQDCNFCTQVCPTGAIRPLDIAAKREARMGLARIDAEACLPFRSDALRQECDLCYLECRQAGFHAIELRETRIELNPPPPEGMFSEMELDAMRRIRVPVVKADACVGCGICQYRCHTRHVVQEPRLRRSAVEVFALAGPQGQTPRSIAVWATRSRASA